MADSTLRLTFQEMQIRVAEYLGIADYSGGAAAVPVSAHDLDLVKRLVNDGYRRFLAENPLWNFLAVPLSVTFGTNTVSSDNARYYLPDDFYGVLLTPFTYGSTGPRLTIDPVPEEVIREMQAANDSTGDPSAVTFRPINVSETATQHRWEAVFWPTPSGTQVVTARYRRFPNKLSSNSDVSVAGYQHDRTVLSAALAAAETDRDDDIGVREKVYQTDLARSLRLDARATPGRSVPYGDRSESRAAGRPLSYYGVDTYNDNSVE